MFPVSNSLLSYFIFGCYIRVFHFQCDYFIRAIIFSDYLIGISDCILFLYYRMHKREAKNQVLCDPDVSLHGTPVNTMYARHMTSGFQSFFLLHRKNSEWCFVIKHIMSNLPDFHIDFFSIWHKYNTAF